MCWGFGRCVVSISWLLIYIQSSHFNFTYCVSYLLPITFCKVWFFICSLDLGLYILLHLEFRCSNQNLLVNMPWLHASDFIRSFVYNTDIKFYYKEILFFIWLFQSFFLSLCFFELKIRIHSKIHYQSSFNVTFATGCWLDSFFLLAGQLELWFFRYNTNNPFQRSCMLFFFFF